LGKAASFTLSRGILPIIALNSLFCLFLEQLIFNRQETTNGQKIQNYCVFKLKQFNIYMLKALPWNVIIEYVGHSMLRCKSCCCCMLSFLVFQDSKRGREKRVVHFPLLWNNFNNLPLKFLWLYPVFWRILVLIRFEFDVYKKFYFHVLW